MFATGNMLNFDVKTDTGLGAITVDITAVIRLMIKVLPPWKV